MKESEPARTATEQLLITSAADRAAEQLAAQITPGRKVFVDATNFDAPDGKYAIASIRDHMMRRGLLLADDKGSAETIVEIRSGALSMDDAEILYGVPTFSVPLPLTGQLTFPELAIYKRQNKEGVAQFSAVQYDAKSRTLIATADAQAGYSHLIKQTVLLFFSWSKNDSRTDDPAD